MSRGDFPRIILAGAAGSLALTLVFGIFIHAQACSVPVFRYALERWPADPYQAYVFHRGELSNSHKQILERLGTADEFGMPVTNIEVATTIDLDADPDKELVEFWERQANAELPWLVVFYPRAARIPEIVFDGQLDESNVASLTESRVRREIAQRLTSGETAVWLFLDSGDKEQDDAAFARLEKDLVELEPSFRLPEIEQADVEKGYISVAPDSLRVEFSTLRVARDDPEETALVNMLVGTEPDLKSLNEPMAFPVFGRGRVLYALVGEGIIRANLEEACQQLLGPCTCQVKEQNPGTDLLMTASWDAMIKPSIDTQGPAELPLMPGVFVADLPNEGNSADLVDDADESVGSAPDTQEELVSEPGEASPVATTSTADPMLLPSSQSAGRSVLTNVLLVGAVLVFLIGIATAFMWRGSGNV